jgi:hypothetical protein
MLLLPNCTSSLDGSLSELSNLLRLKRCFRVPTIFLGYYITSKLINNTCNVRKLNIMKFKELLEKLSFCKEKLSNNSLENSHI